ncbi:regulator of competence-specific genes [Desulfosporosinus orientis DSM 765]|uniref:Regulator of competence-specific genes n=1 Tax=Desulfosporosinus orientis (strain ATCC 19365 / DSM 765 / NCIMB 8382 / VKM B-1628 / Singapore I) TaxID=768706 RepID=G7WIH2_DESOD|nr:TfoX/Sxy family protein [Desulfosporosinus orientis]AET69046.1 regulator of competence-specific genes [Desulfosporosinus orientis DSM 765]
MAVSESFKDYVLDQLGLLDQMGFIKVKKMFGGAGLYYDGLIFGLLADDVLYFKVDDSNRSDYEKAGTEAFRPFAHKPMVMSYYEVPVDIMEDREQLADWVWKALLVSKNNPPKKKKKKKASLSFIDNGC